MSIYHKHIWVCILGLAHKATPFMELIKHADAGYEMLVCDLFQDKAVEFEFITVCACFY